VKTVVFIGGIVGALAVGEFSNEDVQLARGLF